jgi:hypothetical protein
MNRDGGEILSDNNCMRGCYVSVTFFGCIYFKEEFCEVHLPQVGNVLQQSHVIDKEIIAGCVLLFFVTYPWVCNHNYYSVPSLPFSKTFKYIVRLIFSLWRKRQYILSDQNYAQEKVNQTREACIAT